MADDPKPIGTTTPNSTLTPDQKERWNKFIDFVALQKMTGNPVLDQRNKQIGMGLLQKFNFTNPQSALPTDIVPQVQQELQDYRKTLVDQWKAGKVGGGDIKSEDEIMPGLSVVDGWPGTKTLSFKFPGAKSVVIENGKKTVKDYGLDTQKFDKESGWAANNASAVK